MHIKSLTLAASGLALIATNPAVARTAHAPACHTLSAAQLDRQFAGFNAAWATKNPDRVITLFDDDAVLLATVAATPRTSPAAIRDYFVEFLKGNPVARIETSTIKSGCNWAMRAGTWTVDLTDPATGTITPVKARYTFLYQYEDRQWKIEHLHSSVLPPKP